jgi:pentatricopeptide repeat protein
MAQVTSSQVPSEGATGLSMSLLGEMLDQVVSLVFQAVITWALVKILPNFFTSFQKKTQSMFKIGSRSGNDASATVPAGLTKATAFTGPPGLMPETGSICRPVQPDETNLDKKDQPSSKVIKESSHLLVKRMKSLSIEDLKAGQVTPWLILAESLARANDPENASNLFKTVIQEGFGGEITNNHYSVIVTSYARGGNSVKAEEWLEEMLQTKRRASAVCFGSVIDAFAKQGNVAKAEKWLERMIEKDVQANVISYTAVVEACARVGDVAKAEGWLNRMSAAGIEGDDICYNNVIGACAKCGDIASRALGL